MVRVLLPLIAVGLAVYALADCATSTEQDRSGIPKGLWIVLIIFLPFVGPLAWILVKRSQRARYATTATGYPAAATPTARPARRRSGPVAPDDDPDFLWTLEQQRRRDARSAGDSTADEATEDVTGKTAPADGPAGAPGKAGPTSDAVDDAPDDERDGRNERDGRVSDEDLPDDPFTEPPGGTVGGSGSSR